MANEKTYEWDKCTRLLSDNLIEFSQDERERLLQCLETVRYRKQSHVSGVLISNNVCIVGNGAIRHYAYQGKAEEQTLRFTFAGELLHYYGEQDEQLQAISDCVIYVVSHKDFAAMVADGENRLKECMDHLVMQKLGFEVNLLRISPEERCRLIQQKDKEIFLNVPAKYIASYLGITPQALCRIRKRQLGNIKY